MRPQKGTYPAFYNNYISLVKEENVSEALNRNWKHVQDSISSVPATKENFAYADGKWTVKQVLNHMSDTERIFAYRALRFARKDPQQPLPFEENDYAQAADVSKRSLADLLNEFNDVRAASISLFKSFSGNTFLNSGHTSMGDATVLSIGFAISGHAAHHLNVLKERY
jgi:predicted glycosyl hydrolase (DUF1957 family)